MSARLTTRADQKKYKGIKIGQPWLGVMAKHIFICPIHGEVEARPTNVQQGRGFCPFQPCNPNGKVRGGLVTEEIAKKYKGIKIGQPWKGAREKHIFICPIHGEVEARPDYVHKGQGFCKYQSCNPRGKVFGGLVTEEIAKKYKGIKIGQPWNGTAAKHIFICPIHGEVEARPDYVHKGQGFCKYQPCNPTGIDGFEPFVVPEHSALLPGPQEQRAELPPSRLVSPLPAFLVGPRIIWASVV